MDTKQLAHPLVSSLRYIASGLLLALSAQALANPFYGSVRALSGVSDNGHKVEEDTASERQEEYSLNLGGKWNNSLLDFNMGYDASEKRFSEKSQENKTTLDGTSSLLIGRGEQPASLLLSHSRNTILSAPDSVNLTQNQDEKSVFTARPTLRQRITAVDSLLLNGEYSRINYSENELKDSLREGGSLVLLHKFSPLDNLQLSAQHTSIEFKRSPQANYDLSEAALTYSAKLRKLSYSVKVGSNKAAPEVGEETSSPSYELNIVFNSGTQIFSFSGNRELTDTSAEAGSILPENELLTSDGVDIDHIERTSYGFNWSVLALCGGCSVMAGVTQTNDDYLDTGETGKELGWSLRGSYALTHAAVISLQFAGGDHTYTDPTIGHDYKMLDARLKYDYQFNRDLGVNLIVRQEKRYGEFAAQIYTESFAGAGLNYKF